MKPTSPPVVGGKKRKKDKKRKKVQFDKDETVLFTLPHVDLNKHFGFGRYLSHPKFQILNES